MTKQKWLWAICFLGLLCLSCSFASASVSGDWTYQVSNRQVTITKYNGSDAAVVTPTTLGGYPVTMIGANAFEMNTSLVNLTLSEGITTIGKMAFYNASSLAVISFPSSLTQIDEWAFAYCGRLGKVNLPEGLTDLGDFSFCYCIKNSSLYNTSKVVLPSTLQNMGYGVFKNCSFLNEVVISPGVEEISDSAFYGCYKITSITLPDSVLRLGSEVFSGCSSLEEINIPETVGEIGESAFNGCSSLTQITLPNGLNSLSSGIFQNCTQLQTLNIPRGLKTIGTGAFSGCKDLQSIIIPASVEEIMGNPFSACPNIEIEIEEGSPFRFTDHHYLMTSNGELLLGLNVSGEVVIPDSVTEIAPEAFSRNESITSVQIPESVRIIGDKAFGYCHGLISVYIPDTVTEFGTAFYACRNLESVRLPAGLTSIPAFAFDSCSSLKTIEIPDTVTNIGEWAFEYCSSLQIIAIPEGVTAIGYSAFRYCNGLETVIIPSTVSSIDGLAFADCGKLNSVYMFAALSGNDCSLADDIFRNSLNVHVYTQLNTKAAQYASEHGLPYDNTEYNFTIREGQVTIVKYLADDLTISIATIPETICGLPVTKIGEAAFKGRQELRSVWIPGCVAEIGNEAFSHCKLQAVNGYPSLGTACVTFAQGLQVIGDSAFLGNLFTGSLTFPDSVVSIGKNAFAVNSDLGPVITIPGSVRIVDDGAFSDCSGIGIVNVDNGVQEIGNSVFDFDNNVDIYLPDSLTRFGDSGDQAVGNTNARLFANIRSDCAKMLGYRGLPFWYNSCEYQYITEDDRITGLILLDGTLEEADCIISSEVTEIGEEAFAQSAVRYVLVCDHTTTIREKAFAHCDQLRQITIPSSVTTIASDAFDGCPDDFWIIGEEESEAQRYAGEHLYVFVQIQK